MDDIQRNMKHFQGGHFFNKIDMGKNATDLRFPLQLLIIMCLEIALEIQQTTDIN